jgi:hypothetical protein
MTIPAHVGRFRFNGKACEVRTTTGQVQAADMYAKTHVTGSGGGATTTHHGPYSSSTTSIPVSISSSTSYHTRLFLIERDGTEHALELDGYKDFLCRKDLRVSLLYAIGEKSGRGPLRLQPRHEEDLHRLARHPRLGQAGYLHPLWGGGTRAVSAGDGRRRGRQH